MIRHSRVRVVVYNIRSGGQELHRTLVSLARQDIGPGRLEIALPTAHPTALAEPAVQHLLSALDLRRVEIIDTSGHPAALGINEAARGKTDHLAAEHLPAEHLAFVPEGARLHTGFLSRLLDALPRTQNASAAFCGHTAGNAEGIAFVRARAYRQEMLTRRNPVGPATLISAQAWDSLGGLRAGLRLHWWDLWLRLALGGGKIIQVPELLASCPSARRLGAAQDGAAKALLVAHTPGAFEPDVCRWALAHLRGEAWAGPFTSGRIPSPRDVAALWSGFGPPLIPGSQGWERPLRHSA